MSIIKRNSSGSEGDHGNITRVESDQQHIEWQDLIGLENANLQALDSLSWWMKKGDVPTNHLIESHAISSLPMSTLESGSCQINIMVYHPNIAITTL